MTLSELNGRTVTGLTASLGEREARATARLLMEDVLNVTPTTLFTRGDRVVEPETIERFDRYVQAIAAGTPPQYVVGSARFMGMELKVTPAVLIPRPETAELVDIITDRAGSRPDLHVLDIGTGSGCIAIALARALTFPRVEALDVSADALDVARGNAAALGAKIDFFRADILAYTDTPATPYDIIVSNPPYIAESERTAMEPRVKDHEPATALFVPDDDPLRFYRAIARYAAGALAADGTLYFEINPLFASQLRTMLADEGFGCDIVRDSHGKERFAIACRQ